MKPTAFPNHNVVFAKDQPEYVPLPAHRDAEGRVTTVWEITSAELKELFRTRRICVQVLTFNQQLQPILLTADIPEPFREPINR